MLLLPARAPIVAGYARRVDFLAGRARIKSAGLIIAMSIGQPNRHESVEGCCGLSSVSPEIWMLTLHAKNVSDDIPAHILKKIKEEIDA